MKVAGSRHCGHLRFEVGIPQADLDGVTVRFLDGADTWQVTGEAPFGN